MNEGHWEGLGQVDIPFWFTVKKLLFITICALFFERLHFCRCVVLYPYFKNKLSYYWNLITSFSDERHVHRGGAANWESRTFGTEILNTSRSVGNRGSAFHCQTMNGVRKEARLVVRGVRSGHTKFVEVCRYECSSWPTSHCTVASVSCCSLWRSRATTHGRHSVWARKVFL